MLTIILAFSAYGMWEVLGVIGVIIILGITLYLAVRSRQALTWKGDPNAGIMVVSSAGFAGEGFRTSLTNDDLNSIKDTLDVVKFVAQLLNGIYKSSADGKLNYKDIPYFFSAATSLIPAVTDIKNVRKEYKEYTDEQRQYIITLFKEQLVVQPIGCEEAIESMFEHLFMSITNIRKIVACKAVK